MFREKNVEAVVHSRTAMAGAIIGLLFVFDGREAIAEAIIDLLLVFFISSRSLLRSYASQSLQICFLFIRSCNFN